MKNIQKISFTIALLILTFSCSDDSSTLASGSPASGTVAVSGCTDETAANYNSEATSDDGSCIISGCTDSVADNYSSAATQDDGSCVTCLEFSTQSQCTGSCYWRSTSIAGYQMVVSVTNSDEVVLVAGGDAEAAGFSNSGGSTSDQGATTFLGFSFSGATFNDGTPDDITDSGILFVFETTGNPSAITEMVFTDVNPDPNGDGTNQFTVTFWDGSGTAPSSNHIYFESIGNNQWNVRYSFGGGSCLYSF